MFSNKNSNSYGYDKNRTKRKKLEDFKEKVVPSIISLGVGLLAPEPFTGTLLGMGAEAAFYNYDLDTYNGTSKPMVAGAIGGGIKVLAFGAVCLGLLISMENVKNDTQQKYDSICDVTYHQVSAAIQNSLLEYDETASNVNIASTTINFNDNKLTTLASYDSVVSSGVKINKLANVVYTVSPEALNTFNYESQNYFNYTSNAYAGKKVVGNQDMEAPLQYWSTHQDKQTTADQFLLDTANALKSYAKMFNSVELNVITPIGNSYSFNNALLSSALYANPTLVSDTTGYVSGLFASGKTSTSFISQNTQLVSVSDAFNNTDGTSSFFLDYVEAKATPSTGIGDNRKDYPPTYTYRQGRITINTDAENSYNEFVSSSCNRVLDLVNVENGTETYINDLGDLVE